MSPSKRLAFYCKIMNAEAGFSHLIDGEGRREPEHEVLAAVEAAEHGGLLGVVVKVAAVERVRQGCACNKEECNLSIFVIFEDKILCQTR